MKNPILEGYNADPDIDVFNGKYYIYPTRCKSEEKNTAFEVFSSDDLKTWKKEGTILDFKDVPWTENKWAWAPAICERNGKYYLYYSGNCNIGVAVSDSPAGRFTDKGTPLVAKDDYPGLMIDPEVFIDDDGTAYFYWGNQHLYATILNDDMMSFKEEVREITPSSYTEAPCVFKRNGIYYFTWSLGDTCRHDYHVRYGRSSGPLEKPKGDDIILHCDFADDKRIRCTGHHSILNIPGTDEWYIIYHRFNTELYGDVEGLCNEAAGYREICIDRLYFDEDGNILPVKPTND